MSSFCLINSNIYYGDEEGNLSVFSLENSKSLKQFKVHDSRIKKIEGFEFKNKKYLMTISSDGNIRIWNLADFIKKSGD